MEKIYESENPLTMVLRKMMLIMKLTTFLLLIFVLQLSASVYSQSTKLSFDMQGTTIKEVLQIIESKTDYRFIYENEKINLDSKVDIQVEQESVENILKKLFHEKGIQYSITESNLILINPTGKSFPENTGIQQARNVTGKVSDSTGSPLPGVTVVVKGTTNGIITDVDGNYTLTKVPADAVLVFSFVGMRAQEIPVAGKSVIDITMQEETIGIDEIVAVGYGTQKKTTLTGSVTAVGGNKLVRSPAIGVSNSIAGLLPGVIASNRSGEPGRDDASILIRGKSTTGDTSPLVVVDGIQAFEGWEKLNSNDIESISVLKDASAAIYGARAANGVILITTKRGTVGKPTINYTFSQGITKPTRIPEMASSALFAEFVNDRLIMNGSSAKYTDEEIQKFKDGSDPVNYPNTDWYGEVLKKYSLQGQHNLSINGGTENIRYLVSGSYSNQDGIFKHGSTNFKTYSLLARFDANVSNYVKVGFDMNAAMDNGNYPAYSTNSIFDFLGRNLPTEPVYWPNGYPSAGVSYGNNPAVMCTDATGNNNERMQRYSAKITVDISIPWVQGLGVDGYFVYTNNTEIGKNWQKPWETYSYDKTTDTYTLVTGGGITKPQLTESLLSGRGYLVNLRVKYERQFNEHHLNTFIAVEQSEDKNNNFSAFRKDFSSAALDQMDFGSLTGMTAYGSAYESGRQNVFGRISYGFQEKYLADFNFRYDGSSNFPKSKRWGFFPGGSLAWRVSQENFIKDNFDYITNLKLRASYGEIGNDQINAFQWLSTYTLGDNGYPFGMSPVTTLGLIAGVTPNANITWEVAKATNIGLDGTLWQGLFGFTIDAFKQKRSNILATRNLAIPFFTGLTLPDENIGVVENKGIELELTHYRTLGNFLYKVEGNVAYAKSKVIDVSEAQNVPEWQKAEGHVIDAERFYRATGIIRTQAELESIPIVSGTKVGDLKYEDVNNDDQITEADMVRLDKTNTPEITFGLNLSASYKNFSLWAHFAGQARAWQYFHKYSKEGGYNSLKELLENRYKTGSMDSKYPIIPSSETETMDISGFHSTFWLKDASFVRLKTLELSYTVPEDLLSKAKIKSMRIFINGNNLFTIDKLKWYDPEGARTTGDFYPQNKIYNIGINVSF